MHAFLGIDLPGTRKGPSLRSRAQTRLRRLRYWLAGFAWFGIMAVLVGVAGAALAVAEQPFSLVVAMGFLSCALAILSTKET